MPSEYVMKLIHISWSKIYQYKSVTFEFHEYCGPTFLRRHGHVHRDMLSIKGRQWGEFEQWCKLSEDERELYRVF